MKVRIKESHSKRIKAVIDAVKPVKQISGAMLVNEMVSIQIGKMEEKYTIKQK